MINLSTKIPEHFARFTRLFEIVSTEENDLTRGRDRYRLYQQRGYPLTNFMADKS
jgi:DNA polymerase-3 subunit chi